MATMPPEDRPGTTMGGSTAGTTGTGGTTGGGTGMRRGPGDWGPGAWGGARMPWPGNAEATWVLLATLGLGILAWIADGISDEEVFWAFVAMSVAYLVSRGIAKASRVLEQ